VPIVLTMAPFYLALERAYFRDEGLVVEPEEVQFAGNQAQLMAAGGLTPGSCPCRRHCSAPRAAARHCAWCAGANIFHPPAG